MEENKSSREKIQKIKNIIETEIEKELINKQNEVTDISEKIKNILRNLDLLKYIVAVNYYDQNPTLTQKKSGQEEDVEEEKPQTQIHPCVKKLMPFRSNYNKSFGDLFSSHSYETRNSKKSNFSETVTDSEKYASDNGSQEKSNSFSNSTLKMPQYIPPLPNEDETVGSVNSTRGSMSKECYRVIVGNISKWIPSDTREDSSTHKWMVYIRSKDPSKDVTQLLKKVRYFLHESYKPHDIIDVTSPPFRLTRRGWGEFPIRVQLHFSHPLNKPVDIIHNLKLDMSCSGVQTLGGETVVEVHLHQNNPVANGKKVNSKSVSVKKAEPKKEEILREKQDVFDGSLLTIINGIKFDIKKENEESETVIRQEREEIFENIKLFNSKMEKVNEALNNSRKFLLDRRKIAKIIEIEHSYLKSEENVDDTINNFTSSILKLEELGKNSEKAFKNGAAVNLGSQTNKKNQERMSRVEICKSRSEEEIFKNLKMAANKMETESQSKYCLKNFKHMYFVNVVQRAQESRVKTVEGLIKWFVQRWPIVTKLALDPVYKTVHPYSSPSEEEFFRHNIGKQRSAEWFRAKAIQKVLKSLKPVVPIEEEIWSTKQILLWSRFHGYTPSYPQKNPKAEARENEMRNKRLKPNESSSESEEESFDFPSKKTKTFEDKFLNGLSLSEKKKNHRKYKRREGNEEAVEKIRNYRECNTCTEANDSQRFGAEQFHVPQSSNSPDEIDVVLVDEKPVNESPSKKRGASLSVLTTPSGEMLFNKFVCDTAKQIGVKIVEEETMAGVKTDTVARVLGQCAASFLDELIRRSFAQAWIRNGERCPESLEMNDILATLIEHRRFDIFTNRGLGTQNTEKS